MTKWVVIYYEKWKVVLVWGRAGQSSCNNIQSQQIIKTRKLLMHCISRMFAGLSHFCKLVQFPKRFLIQISAGPVPQSLYSTVLWFWAQREQQWMEDKSSQMNEAEKNKTIYSCNSIFIHYQIFKLRFLKEIGLK